MECEKGDSNSRQRQGDTNPNMLATLKTRINQRPTPSRGLSFLISETMNWSSRRLCVPLDRVPGSSIPRPILLRQENKPASRKPLEQTQFCAEDCS